MKPLYSTIACSILIGYAIGGHGQTPVGTFPNGAPVQIPTRILDRALGQADVKEKLPYVCVTSVLPPLLHAPYTDPRIPIAAFLVPSEMPKQLSDIEARFKMTERKFGEITVFAPAMMTILSADVPVPDMYADLSQQDAFKLLAASLSDDQWNLLSSDQGLSDEDLTSDSQRSLWKAALNLSEKILLHKKGDILKPNEGLDVTGKQSQFRLHLQRHVDVAIPTSEHMYTYVPAVPKTTTYEIQDEWQRDKSLDGFQPRQEVLNVPKTSDLTYSDTRFSPTVSMAPAPELGSLILRIGLRTKTEIYCDARMAKFHVVMAPVSGSIRAGDLLQALAFAVTGTYRKVGPAYILTNDIMGLGTKTAILSRFQKETDSRRQKPLDDAGDILSTKHSLWTLPLGGSQDLDLTPEQRKQMTADHSQGAPDPNFLRLIAKMSDLTLAQRASAQAAYDSLIKTPKYSGTPKIDVDIAVVSSPNLRMTVPGVDGDVDLKNIYTWNLFEPSVAARIKRDEEYYKRTQEHNTVPQGPAKTYRPQKATPEFVASWVRQFAALTPRRAVVVLPTSVSDARKVVEEANALGFNQIWLTVFAPDVSDNAHTSGHLSAGELKIIKEAIRAGAAHNIAVFVHLSLFTWPKSTPADLRDLDILGQDSATASVRLSLQWATRSGQPYSGPSAKNMSVSVNPMDPGVQKTLFTVHKQLAEIPGIAGIVWSDTSGNGYVKTYYDAGAEMGYSEPARLAYVRQAQVDPVDVISNEEQIAVDISVPVMQQDYRSARAILLDWKKFRIMAAEDLLKALRVQINPPSQPTSMAKTFLVAERSDYSDGWIGSWDTLTSSMPFYHVSSDYGQSNKYPIDAAKQARMESRINYVSLHFWPLDNYRSMVDSGKRSLQMSKWDGVVLYADGLTKSSALWPQTDNTIEALNRLFDDLSPMSAVPLKAATAHVKKVK